MHTCIYRPVAHCRMNHTCHWPTWKTTTALPRLQSLQQSTGEKVVLLSRSDGRATTATRSSAKTGAIVDILVPVGRHNKFLSAAASSSSSSWTACIHGPARRSTGALPCHWETHRQRAINPCVDALLLRQLDIDYLLHTSALVQRASGRKKCGTNAQPRCALLFVRGTVSLMAIEPSE
jgi:hypothetical protein